MQIKNNKNGFSLLELLLVVGVTAGLFTFVAVILNGWGKNSIDQRVSNEMLQLQNAAAEYVRFNIDTIIATDIPLVGNIDEINIATNIIAGGFLPAGYTATNSYRQNLRVFVRHLESDSINDNLVEVITISDGPPMDDGRLFNAAQNGQNSIGIISNLNISATCCNGNIQSTSGTWSVDLADFAAVVPALPAPGANGGFMAAYGLVSVNNNISDNYLFRNTVPMSPQLNVMETDLNLNNNNITNAGIIVSESMAPAGAVTFGGIEADGSLSSYVLSVRDNLTVGQNVDVNEGGNDSKGNVRIFGEGTAAVDFTVNGALNVQTTVDLTDILNPVTYEGNISANTLTLDNLDIAGTTRLSTANANNASLTANGPVILDTLGFTNEYTGDNLQALNLENVATVTTSTASLSDLIITDPLTTNFPSNVTLIGNATVSGGANIGQLNALGETTITNMTRCNTGCPGLGL